MVVETRMVMGKGKGLATQMNGSRIAAPGLKYPLQRMNSPRYSMKPRWTKTAAYASTEQPVLSTYNQTRSCGHTQASDQIRYVNDETTHTWPKEYTIRRQPTTSSANRAVPRILVLRRHAESSSLRP